MTHLSIAQIESLYNSVDRDAVFHVMRDIVLELTGSEAMAIFERNGANFSLAAAFGVDAERLSGFRAGDGPIGHFLRDGEIFLSPNAAGTDARLEACIPLKKRDKVTGVILVFRLHAGVAAIERVSAETLELFAMHACIALDRATLHDRAAVMQV